MNLGISTNWRLNSGVLAESLHRSKAKWLSEGIFEKYWTKPIKKKGTLEQPENNPAKDTMTKLGTCTITVEPHIFEAVMYAIKDPTPRPAPAAPIQQPMYRPIIQYGPPGGMMPPPPPTPPPPKQFPTPQLTPQASPRTQDAQMSNKTNTHNSTPMQSNSSATNGYHNTAGNSTGTNLTPAPANKSTTDPVIQMLAERAATDPDLKALMRIVANGEATADELKKFQSHIDELTRIQKAREAENATPAQTQHAPPPTSNGQQINSQPTPTPTPPIRTALAPASKVDPQYHAQTQALRSKGPVPSSKPDITGVVFEFPGGSGDRFRFPKFSILEYLPQGQVIASFLIVRKGSSSDSPAYDPDLDYYQPITIRLYAHQGRQLEALQKIVAPPDEVRRYMDDIMDHATRAEYVLLAMRLPKDKEQSPAAADKEQEEEAEKLAQIASNLQWPTTTSTPVQKMKPPKRLATEAEKYQSFIAGVAAEVA